MERFGLASSNQFGFVHRKAAENVPARGRP